MTSPDTRERAERLWRHEFTVLDKTLSDAEVDEFAINLLSQALLEARNAGRGEMEAHVLRGAWTVLFLDGRNEHGTHVLPSYPTSMPADYESSLPDQAEYIMRKAEEAGFEDGDHVWTLWHYNAPQIGEEGRVEFAGYWEFESIDVALSERLAATAIRSIK